MFILLNGEALDVALEFKEEVISDKGGVKSIIARLDKRYKKNDPLSMFHAFVSFETYEQRNTLSLPEYIN